MFRKRIKHLVLALFIALTAGFIAVPALASADFKGDACGGLQAIDGNNTQTCPSGSDTSLTNVLKTIISILSIIVGVIAVIMVIVGGFKFITSGGDSSNTAAARNTVIYALVGLIVAALAQVLVHFVLFRVSGATPCATNPSIAASDKVNCKPSCPTNPSIPVTDKNCKK